MRRKKLTTATEIAFIQQAKYVQELNYKLAKQFLFGGITSEIVRYAEKIIFEYEHFSKTKKLQEDKLISRPHEKIIFRENKE